MVGTPSDYTNHGARPRRLPVGKRLPFGETGFGALFAGAKRRGHLTPSGCVGYAEPRVWYFAKVTLCGWVRTNDPL